MCALGLKTAAAAAAPAARRRVMSSAAAAPQSVESARPMDATQFLRPHLLKLAAYTPIEPFEILSARYGLAPEDIIKLDANENPYGPPPEVLQALASMPFPHIYPDAETRALRKALSEMNNVPMENILVGAVIGAAGCA
jgi:histidinol-phosphate aminotransferase